jgi:hypothetical protein
MCAHWNMLVAQACSLTRKIGQKHSSDCSRSHRLTQLLCIRGGIHADAAVTVSVLPQWSAVCVCSPVCGCVYCITTAAGYTCKAYSMCSCVKP